MKLFKLTLAFALAAILAQGTMTFAQSRDLVALQSGDWNDGNVWKLESDQGGSFVAAPDSDDNARIAANITVVVDFADEGGTGANIANAATLTVDEDGTLSMRDDGELQLGTSLSIDSAPSAVFEFAADDGETRPILRARNGTLVIEGHVQTRDPAGSDGGAGGKIERLATNAVTIYTGSLVDTTGGELEIDAPVMNLGTVEATSYAITFVKDILSDSTGLFRANGADMIFEGDVENDGTIDARSDSIVTFSSDSTLNANSTGLIQVIAADAQMVFNHDVTGGAPTLSGAKVNVEAGEMLFQKGLSIGDGFRHIGGKVTAAPTVTFTASGDYSS